MEYLSLLVGQVQWEEIEVHLGLEQLHYLRTLMHSLLATGEAPVLQPIPFELFEGRSSSFFSFPSSLEGDNIQLGDQVGTLSMA